uniref:Uncharacterized protein n=1 Tax=Romanomermis culicivorax TaxID=13658 RepID=A0A915JYJ5_ROMCU
MSVDVDGQKLTANAQTKLWSIDWPQSLTIVFGYSNLGENC